MLLLNGRRPGTDVAHKHKSTNDVDLHACMRGDKRAWDAFVTRWSGLIFTAVRHVICKGEPGAADSGSGSGVEIDDATQEVFVRLVKDDFRVLKSFDARRATLSTWLTIVARSTAIDCMRRKRLGTTTLESHHAPTSPAPGPTQSLIDDAPTDSTGAALPMHLLTDRQRLVLGMLFDEGLSVSQAAKRMGVDEQTIRSTKHKALSRLRQHFGVDSPG
jgi:RNA polymerase sigma-70 factor (ECF subfamily)